MATANVSTFLRQLTRGMVAETLADQSDRQLVERLLGGQGEAVFEAIVRRHGPMVYRVCWRVVQHQQDAEDAFQATFLVLARKLGTLRKQASLASWLHGVAHRVALEARASAALRRRHERQACDPVPAEARSGDVSAALDAELAGLPEKWRLPLVLCYLEGRTQDEAAGQLGWSQRTLRRRLEEARAALGRRLARCGVGPAALSAVLLSDCVASAAPSPALLTSTVVASALVASGEAAAASASAQAAALAEAALKNTWLAKLRVVFATLAISLLLGTAGLGLCGREHPGDGPRASRVAEDHAVERGNPEPVAPAKDAAAADAGPQPEPQRAPEPPKDREANAPVKLPPGLARKSATHPGRVAWLKAHGVPEGKIAKGR